MLRTIVLRSVRISRWSVGASVPFFSTRKQQGINKLKSKLKPTCFISNISDSSSKWLNYHRAMYYNNISKKLFEFNFWFIPKPLLQQQPDNTVWIWIPVMSKIRWYTYTMSSTAGRGDLQVPGEGWCCPTEVGHTPAYCPGTVMSKGAVKIILLVTTLPCVAIF